MRFAPELAIAAAALIDFAMPQKKEPRRDFLAVGNSARAFSACGRPSSSPARSVAMSLWNVDDESTSELMPAFYANLKKGMTKDRALQQAKIILIQSDRHFRPFHWASFILTGQTAPIPAIAR